jgi:hypothetical protein
LVIPVLRRGQNFHLSRAARTADAVAQATTNVGVFSRVATPNIQPDQIFTFAEHRERLCLVETNIDEIDGFLSGPTNSESQAIVLRAFGYSETPALSAVISNGLAA